MPEGKPPLPPILAGPTSANRPTGLSRHRLLLLQWVSAVDEAFGSYVPAPDELQRPKRTRRRCGCPAELISGDFRSEIKNGPLEALRADLPPVAKTTTTNGDNGYRASSEGHYGLQATRAGPHSQSRRRWRSTRAAGTAWGADRWKRSCGGGVSCTSLGPGTRQQHRWSLQACRSSRQATVVFWGTDRHALGGPERFLLIWAWPASATVPTRPPMGGCQACQREVNAVGLIPIGRPQTWPLPSAKPVRHPHALAVDRSREGALPWCGLVLRSRVGRVGNHGNPDDFLCSIDRLRRNGTAGRMEMGAVAVAKQRTP